METEDKWKAQHKYRKNNPERVKLLDRLRYERNKEKIKKQAKKWRLNNMERDRETKKKWKENNMDKFRASRRKSYLKIMSDPVLAQRFYERVGKSYKSKRNGNKLNPILRFKILNRDNFTCKYCGRKPPEVKLQVDHIIPRSKGGADIESNLVVSCSECNLGKTNIII